jgi:hypothetical protein
MNETEAIKQIHALLDGRQWHTYTIERIAEIVVSTGRVIREPLVCKLCGFTIEIPELAHCHGGGWIGEDCCWEEAAVENSGIERRFSYAIKSNRENQDSDYRK